MMTVAAQQAQVNRIRGPNLDSFITNSRGVPMVDALLRADNAGRVIASNKMLSGVLVSNKWRHIIGVLPCWSGTMAGYVEPGRPFRQGAEQISSYGNGYFIVYTCKTTNARYLFPVPDEHLDKADAVLVTEHPHFTLVTDGRDCIVSAMRIAAVSGFPALGGWFLGDPKYDIPQGNEVRTENPDARFLWRTDKRVGLVMRQYLFGDPGDGRTVSLDSDNGYGLGVAVEAP